MTPGNPLKDTRGLARSPSASPRRALAHHPRIDVSGLEAEIGARYTYDTVRYLIARCPGVRFVWIMGADNLRSFHRWQNWRAIAAMVPIAVVDRLGPSLYATAGPAGQALGRARIPETAANSLAGPASRRPGSTSMASNRRCPRPRCALPDAGHEHVTRQTRKTHRLENASNRGLREPREVETINRPCLS